MAKIAVIGISGSSHFMSTDHFHEKGETVEALSLFSEIGGKGINQAIAAARMGGEVSFLAAVGCDSAGEACRSCCEENGLRPYLIKKAEPTATAFILTDKSGDNRVTVYRGAVLEERDVDVFEEAIAGCDILLLQNEVPEKVNLAAISLAAKYEKRVILNPAPAREGFKPPRGKIFLATPNEQEERTLDRSLFENLIVTLGGKGCLINSQIHIPATADKSVDTTGAGDTFNGVLAVCIAEGMSLEEAARYATVASGISVTRSHVLGAIPKREEIERRINHE